MIRSTINHRLPVLAATVLAGVLATGNANAVEGNYSGSLSETLKVSGCGKDKDFSFASAILQSNKTWSADTIEGIYEGTYKTKGSRNLVLKLDSSSQNLLMNSMKDWATDLCGTAVKKLTKFKSNIKLKLNKKATTLKGKIVATAKGQTKFGSGQGKYTGKVKMDAI